MMMSHSPLALSLFSCYAHEDAALREQFEKHLAMLKRLGWIQSWSDRDIHAGAEWQQAINQHLHTADLFLLFVSADFLHSEYCYSVEMQEVLGRHQAGEAVVIPILLRPVEWEETPLGALQALPRDGRPVTSWSNPDEAFQQIAREIRVVIEALRRRVVIISAFSDQTFTEHLVQDLTGHGIPVWQAERTLEPTSLKDSLREALAVVVIASPETERARTLKEALRLSEMYQRPVIGVWIFDDDQDNGKFAPHPSPGQMWLPVGPGQEERAFQDIRAFLNKKRSHGVLPPIVSSQVQPEPYQKPRNPYKGLRAFTADDAHDFFGRTSLIDILVASVEKALFLENKGQQPARLLAVVGASGSGKSSVVNAGLLPALQSGSVFESNTWVYLDPIVPGTHPLDALALALFEQFPEKSLTMLREDLGDDSTRGLHLYATRLAKRQRCAHVVLVVDQFEEVFTLTENEQERQQFLDLLVTACTKREGPLIVVLTLWGDFYNYLMQYPTLYTLIVGYLTPMLPMTLPDLRAVITHPAGLPDVQLTFEGNLVGDLLFDVQGQIGALPLLQFTLEQLFERREGHLLTEYAYQEIGGIRGALAKHAEETYLALPSQEHRQLTRTLFLRLLDPGTTEQETTRRRAALTEFVFADVGQTHLMQETRDTFVKARLLTTTANGRRGTTTVEVSHEALIREWPRLVNWLREARDDIHLQQSISRDAATWEQNKHPRDRLYQGTTLKEAQVWATRNTVSRQEQAFLKASVARRLRSLLIVIAVILLVVTSSGIATWIVLSQPHPDYVTTANDDGTGSLRWAIKNAPSGSTITFAPNLKGQTIILKIIDIHITQQHLTIQSPVPSHIAVQVMGVSILVDKRARATIFGITFRGSKTKGQSSLIRNAGTLTLETCSISGNTVSSAGNSDGGGISNSGTLTLTNSLVSGNTASGFEVGYSYGSGHGSGGGISNSGTLTLTNSLVSDNTASGFASSTVEGTGYGSGGGISNSGTLTLTNSLVSGNTASGDGYSTGYGTGYGGGIYNYNSDDSLIAHATLVFCTIVNNSAIYGDGFDIYNEKPADYQIHPYSKIYLKASIVGGNSTQNTPIEGEITSGGYNIIQRMSSVPFVGKTQSTDRSVDDLSHVFRPSPVSRNKDDFTQTYQLLPGTNNPAFDAVPSDACTDATGRRVLTDQRGMPRPGRKKRSCDSGANEYQASP